VRGRCGVTFDECRPGVPALLSVVREASRFALLLRLRKISDVRRGSSFAIWLIPAIFGCIQFASQVRAYRFSASADKLPYLHLTRNPAPSLLANSQPRPRSPIVLELVLVLELGSFLPVLVPPLRHFTPLLPLSLPVVSYRSVLLVRAGGPQGLDQIKRRS
jgi:hypothetical protein